MSVPTVPTAFLQVGRNSSRSISVRNKKKDVGLCTVVMLVHLEYELYRQKKIKSAWSPTDTRIPV